MSGQAEAHLRLGHLERAAALFGEQRSIYEDTLAPDDPERSFALSGLGRARLAEGRRTEAATLLRQALALAGDHHDVIHVALIELALADALDDRELEAAALTQAAAARLEPRRACYPAEYERARASSRAP
ncbi:MAG: tetratricopeptide repeat protein [Nannocystaceae bacterium]